VARQLVEKVRQHRAGGVGAGDQGCGNFADNIVVGQWGDSLCWIAGNQLGDRESGGQRGRVAPVSLDEVVDGLCPFLPFIILNSADTCRSSVHKPAITELVVKRTKKKVGYAQSDAEATTTYADNLWPRRQKLLKLFRRDVLEQLESQWEIVSKRPRKDHLV
jgi:hypothetical protein